MRYSEKEKKLKKIVRGYDSAIVAFSGGVDSSVVASVASEVLEDNALAVTARSPILPSWDESDAREVADRINIQHIFVDTDELEDENFVENPKDRCYVCKKGLLERLDKIRRERGFERILDGTSKSDYSDYRPGLQALKEFGDIVKSPLAEAQLTKEDIREIAEKRGLPNADKPSSPCLASRIPFGSEISRDKINKIEKAEEYLRSIGFRVVRVRDHGEVARIEVAEEKIQELLDLRWKITEKMKELGYNYVSVDLEGYRTGSLNPE